jgi:hypothetical protein
MGGYFSYVSVRSSLTKQVKDFIPKKERRAHGTEIADMCVKAFVNQLGVNLTLDSAILVDEMEWVAKKCPMYFPVCPELLQMLWRAKMDVDMDDLGLPSFPKSFAISWPACEIDGVKLRGCLVWWGNGHEREDLVRRFGIKYMGRPALAWGKSDRVSDDEVMMHISYIGEAPSGHIPPYFRCTIPDQLLRNCLKSDDGFRNGLGEYNVGAIGVLPLTDGELHQQYIISKLVVRLLVYMKAFPDIVREGYPDGRNGKEFRSKWTGEVKPTLIGAPVGLIGRNHESPETHFRTWHFRSFPRKDDGTKTSGVVFVRAAIVNAEMVDPITVEIAR